MHHGSVTNTSSKAETSVLRRGGGGGELVPDEHLQKKCFPEKKFSGQRPPPRRQLFRQKNFSGPVR